MEGTKNHRFPNGPEALDNPQASTIRGNWPKISPKWASKVCRSARCVGCLVAWLVASPIFCGKGKRRETWKDSVFLCLVENSSAKNFHGILLLEIKWKFDGGGSDGVSVWGEH